MVKENTNDYQSCDTSFDENGKATVTLIGKGKFAGKYICNGNKTSAEVIEESCTLVALTVDANGGTNTVEYNAKYEASSTVPLTIPTAPEGKEFDKWEVSGTGASVTNNTLTMGTSATTVKEIWNVKAPVSFANDSWSTIIAAVQAAETNGTEYPTEYAVGNTKTIKTTRVISSYEYEKRANYSSDDKLYLISPQEVYGDSFTDSYYSSKGTSRQPDYYGPTLGIGVTTSSYSGAIKYLRGSTTASSWWLRSANSFNSYNFYYVNTQGDWFHVGAYSTRGVSPAFRIGK